ncbi:MAG TPA: IS256 family transposase [Sphingobacteriaceae bacterium]
MELTKLQVRQIVTTHLLKENGFNDVMEIMLEAMMKAERSLFLEGSKDNKANGFRPGKAYGNSRILEFRVPRDRRGEFQPLILTMLRNQEEESARLIGSMYAKGLTTLQVSEIFEEIYGKNYSKSSISRMLDNIREEVDQWIGRPLEKFYPVVLVDAIHVKVRNETNVSTQAFYVVVGVTPERHRDVLSIMQLPQESAKGWEQLFNELRDRGLERIGLMIADGLKSLDYALSSVFPGTPLQRCVTHLKRNVLAKVKTFDRIEIANDLREVFRTSDSSDTVQKGWDRWNAFCEKWSHKYRFIKDMRDNIDYRDYFTYLAYDYRIRGMIYTTNWIERLQRDFRRVLRVRCSMPGESVITLMGKVSIEKKSYKRAIPKLNYDKSLFIKPESMEVAACEILEAMLD